MDEILSQKDHDWLSVLAKERRRVSKEKKKVNINTQRTHSFVSFNLQCVDQSIDCYSKPSLSHPLFSNLCKLSGRMGRNGTYRYEQF